MTRFVLLLIVCLSTLSFASAESIEKLSNEQLFEQANKLFAQGATLAKQDPDKAKALYEDALLRYQYLVSERKIVNGKLFYNLGNLYFMRNELGYAVLNYRRALQLRPTDQNLLANLSVARNKTRTTIKLDSSERLFDLLVNWHEDIPRSLRLRLLQLLVMAIGLAGLAYHKFDLKFPERNNVLGALALAAALTTLSLIVESVRHSEAEGVLVQEQTIGRKGPSEFAYQPSFDQPLAAGMEFQLKEKRGTWARVELLDQRETWVPLSAVEFVDMNNEDLKAEEQNKQ